MTKHPTSDQGAAQKAATNENGLTPVSDALDQLLGSVLLISGVDAVGLVDAENRVLARDLMSPINVPGFDNSAMDGYAVRSSDLSASAGAQIRLRVAQTIAAGRPGEAIKPGTAARIFTGAPIPEYCDAVVIQEHTAREGDDVLLTGSSCPVRPQTNIRTAGEDITAGATILQRGCRLKPQHIGLAASVGLASVPVLRRLKVALFSTGSELIEPGTSLQPGQIYNSNRYVLVALLRKLGCEVIDLGIVPDDYELTRDALTSAAQHVDLILSSGGVSVGETDHVKEALSALGRLDLWRLNMKPGKPLAFGVIDETRFLGLPGNPVSAFVTFCIIARPLILKMQGAIDVMPRPDLLPAGFGRSKAISREDYIRVKRIQDVDGKTQLVPYHSQGSGVGSSITFADGLAIIPPDQVVEEGDELVFLPFDQLLQ